MARGDLIIDRPLNSMCRMNSLTSGIVAIFVYAGVCCGSAVAESGTSDELIPANEELSRPDTYTQAWKKTLLITPGEHGRMVVLPQTVAAEWVVSLYEANDPEDNQHKHYVSLVSASSKIYAAEGGDEVNDVAVTRKVLQLPDELANGLRDVWREMLARRRAPSIRAFDHSAPSIYFSSAEPDGETAWGKVPTVESPAVQLLVNIGMDLAGYFAVSPDARPAMESKIKRQVGELQTLLFGTRV